MTDIAVSSPSEIADRLRQLSHAFPEEAKNATWLELAKVMNDAMKLCPVETGNLRGSRSLPEPVLGYGVIMASIGFSAKYAWYVHELVDNYHKPPTQAKFLEEPLMRALPRLNRRIADRVIWLLQSDMTSATIAERVEELTKPPEK